MVADHAATFDIFEELTFTAKFHSGSQSQKLIGFQFLI